MKFEVSPSLRGAPDLIRGDEAIQLQSGLLRSLGARNDGFTLIELLIALAIFSMVSAAALASLHHMMQSREQQMLHHEANQSLDLAYGHIQQDMLWFVGDVSAEQDSLRFLRTQTSRGSSSVDIQYEVRDGQLFRSGAVILKNIDDLTISWLLADQQWVGVFDQAQLEETPLLLRVQFNAPHLGEVSWVFATPHL